MNWISEKSDSYNPQHLADAGEIVNLVSESRSVSNAIGLFADYLTKASCHLMNCAEYDVQGLADANPIWSAFSPEIEKLRAQFDPKKGCPLVQMAVRNDTCVEASSFYLTGFDETLGSQYLKALNNIGYDQMTVIPISTGNQAFVSFVGLRNRSFEGKFRDQLYLALGQFAAALLIRYPLMRSTVVADRRATNLNLSKREKECLAWSAQGKTSYEISIILKLSEHTINNYISNACRRLDAANKSHAVAKAIQLGIIESNNLF